VRTLKIFAAGVALAIAGLLYTYIHWSLAAFMTPVCSGHWDDYANCRSLAWRCQLGWVAPAPGLLLIAIAVVRFVRWWRTPVPRRVVTGAAASRAAPR